MHEGSLTVTSGREEGKPHKTDELRPTPRREMTIIMDETTDISPVEWEKMIRQLGRP